MLRCRAAMPSHAALGMRWRGSSLKACAPWGWLRRSTQQVEHAVVHGTLSPAVCHAPVCMRETYWQRLLDEACRLQACPAQGVAYK
jgi:hypothetical protein